MSFTFKSLFTAAVAMGSLVAAHPLSNDNLQSRQASVVPIADPVVVDLGGDYMRTTTLADGSILGGYAVSDGPTRILMVTKSTDGGDSWEIIGSVDSGPGDVREIGNAFPLALPDGRILYSFRNHDRAGDDFAHYRITVCVSEDGGVTWSFLSHVDERVHDPVNRNGLWEPFMRLAADGAVQVFYSAENNNGDQDNIMKASTDGGATWSQVYGMSGGDIVGSRDGMIGIANIDNNGNLIGVFENTATGPFSVDAVFSQDDGYSWNSRMRIYTADNNLEAGAPYVVNVGGTLVVDFMSNEAGSGPGVDNGEMKVVTSTDGGRTWGPATVISGLGTHWPGMHVLDDNTFLALYGFNGLGLVSHKHSV